MIILITFDDENNNSDDNHDDHDNDNDNNDENDIYNNISDETINGIKRELPLQLNAFVTLDLQRRLSEINKSNTCNTVHE